MHAFFFKSPFVVAHLRCSRCKLAHYCCKEHQVLHWKSGHRMQCQEICREVVNSPGAVERRELLLSSKPTRTGPPSAAVTGEAPSKMIEERHVHEKAGLRRKIDHQRRNLRELQDRLRHIQMELDARKRRRSGGQTTATTGEQEEVLSEPYRRRIILKELDVSLTGMREAELRVVHEETRRLRALAQEALAETEKDMQSVSRWERFESGFETRDVLANGERRLHMELRYVVDLIERREP